MKKEAKEFGLDLDDPQVQEALAALQKEQENRKKQPPASPAPRRFPWKTAACVLAFSVGFVYIWSWVRATEEDLY